MAPTRSIIYPLKKEDTKLKSSKFICFKSSTLNNLNINKVSCCGQHFSTCQIRKLFFVWSARKFFHTNNFILLCLSLPLHEKVSIGPIPDAETLPRACTSPKPVSCLSCLPAGIASIAPAAVFMWNGWLHFVRGCLNFRVYESSILNTSVGGTDVKLWSLVQL